MNAQINSLRWAVLLFTFCLFQACGKKPIEAIPTQPDGLFTYQLVSEGDGLVRFAADTTQALTEFTWDFGDGSGPVTTPTGRTTHLFTKNTGYPVKLTAKTQDQQQLTDLQTVLINTRLARTFADLPGNKRDTIRILSILTHDSFKARFTDPKDYQYNEYRNQLFIDFMKRTLPNHPKELDGLVFKQIAHALAPEEMARFNQEGDPVAFLNHLLSTPSDPLYQKLITLKGKEAVSRVAFFLKDPTPNGISKYGIGGYAYYEGGYFVLFSTLTETFAHEAGHSFGLAHDTLRDCAYYPLMVGNETKTRGNCASVWNVLPEFQVSGYENHLVVLEQQPYHGYQYAVPDYWRRRYPADPVVRSFTLTYIATTPYYRPGIDLSKTLTDALLAQYNLQLAPSAATSLDNYLALPSGRLSTSRGSRQPVYCLP